MQVGKLWDVEVLNHLAIGQGKWVSFKEHGLGDIEKENLCLITIK